MHQSTVSLRDANPTDCMPTITRSSVHSGIVQLTKTTCHDSRFQSEAVELFTAGGEILQLSLTPSVMPTQWLWFITLSLAGSEEDEVTARQMETFMRWQDGQGLYLAPLWPCFDKRLRTICKESISDLIFPDLQRLLSTDACCCGRHRKVANFDLCCTCVFNGVVILNEECPICMEPLTNHTPHTACCGKKAHERCMSKLGGRCFNCRHEPLSVVASTSA